MTDDLSLILLGCGSSAGVPRLGLGWGACDPREPKNRRTRCSALLERRSPKGVTRVLIDTSPDMRAQLLSEAVDRLDAVLYTHDHADQSHGIDDLRSLAMAQGTPIPVFMDEATAATLTRRFAYCFEGADGYPPILSGAASLRHGEDLVVDGAGGPIRLTPMELQHGRIRALGFRSGPFAYTPDVSDVPEPSFALLAGVQVWAVDALRHRPHSSHAHVEKALGWIDRVAPALGVLTNLHADLDYRSLKEALPDGVVPAYDGARFEAPILD